MQQLQHTELARNLKVTESHFPSDRPRRVAIATLCAAAVAIGLSAKFYAAGFVMLIGMWLYPLLALGHLLVQLFVARSPLHVPRSTMRWCLVSDVVFVVAMLLQIDQGDGFYWLTLNFVYSQVATGDVYASALPGMRGDAHILWYALSFASIGLIICTWIPILRFKRRIRDLEASGTCPECGYRIVPGSVCTECGLHSIARVTRSADVARADS